MKVTIHEHSPKRAGWLHVFGSAPVEVDIAPNGRDKYKVRMTALKALQRQRLIQYVSQRDKIPVSDAEAKIKFNGVSFDAKDVVIVRETELFP